MSHPLFLISAAIVICLGLSFFFSGSETAIISANKFRLRSLHEQGDATAGRLLALLGNTQRLLVMVLIGNNIAGVILALSFGQLIERLWPHLAERKILNIVTCSDALDLAILTPMVVVFAEILPKALFRAQADRVIVAIRPAILFFLALFKPLILVLERFTSLVLSPLSEQRTALMRHLTRQDVINLISPEEKDEEPEAEGAKTEGPAPAAPTQPLGRVIARQAQQEVDRLVEATDERRMIHNIIELQDTRAYEIMTPLVDLDAVQLGRMDLEGFKQFARQSGYSRFPVFRDKIVNIIGTIDVFRVLREGETARRLEDFVERPHYVPETKRVDDLLQEFLRLRLKNAVVVNEYGGCSGWISREDMLEEIVGELEDELDEPSRRITEVAGGAYLVEGRLEIDALNHVLETDFSEEEWATLAGLILNEMGRIPAVGDEVVIDGWQATVVEMTGHRIDKVKLAKNKD